MRVKNRSISLLFLLILTFLSACGATAASEDDIKNKAENVEKEAVYSSSESDTDDADQNRAMQVKEAGNKSSLTERQTIQLISCIISILKGTTPFTWESPTVQKLPGRLFWKKIMCNGRLSKLRCRNMRSRRTAWN